jgi:hypothetical protein
MRLSKTLMSSWTACCAKWNETKFAESRRAYRQ